MIWEVLSLSRLPKMLTSSGNRTKSVAGYNSAKEMRHVHQGSSQPTAEARNRDGAIQERSVEEPPV